MNEELEFDPAQRHLCPDGACTGLVGPDGRCAVCGRDGGPAPERGAASAGAWQGPPDAEAAEAAAPGGIEADAGDGGFDTSRKLCDDGSCVGVIGPDGRCSVCGRVSGS